MSRKNVSHQKAEAQKKTGDSLKWVLIFLLVIGGIYANAYFGSVALGIRAAVGILLAAVIVAVIGMTAKGRSAWEFIKGARTELRKVVWPSKQETSQTTLLVAGMVVVVALLLWGIDAFFFWAVKTLSA